jgi:CheY-like chemotaxis protein
VIDDEPDLLAMLAETLEQDGHEVAVARSGREALARIDAGGSFDLVLIDLRMPDLDGAALIRVLRDRHPDLLPRLILMTGDVLGAGLAASVSELLAPLSEKPPLLEKPVDQDALRRVVAERLATAGPREEHAP